MRIRLHTTFISGPQLIFKIEPKFLTHYWKIQIDWLVLFDKKGKARHHQEKIWNCIILDLTFLHFLHWNTSNYLICHPEKIWSFCARTISESIPYEYMFDQDPISVPMLCCGTIWYYFPFSFNTVASLMETQHFFSKDFYVEADSNS